MINHDRAIGDLLKLLDDLGIAENTIVMYSTDNGPHCNSWPDSGTTPFRAEKNTNWEGGYRVPAFVRWPGHVPAGSVCNEIVSHLDWLPTLLAAAGEPNIKEKLLKGHKAGKKEFKVHLDGYNMLALFTGKEKAGPRKEFYYFSDDADLVALRYDNWKIVFMEQRCPGTCQIWAEPFVTLRIPKVFNLRTDPYEQADITSNTYWDWMIDHAFVLIPAQNIVGAFLMTFKDYPPRQKAASFSLEQVTDKLKAGLECRDQ
jgi:arylsulfatase